jgi:hypothetical protein
MFFMLLDVVLDMSIDFPLSDMASSIFEGQLGRMPDNHRRDAFGRHVAARLESALLECVDWDLRPPTPAQVTYATAISRALGIDLPSDVLRLRGAMNLFLARHSEAFKSRAKQKVAPEHAAPRA